MEFIVNSEEQKTVDIVSKIISGKMQRRVGQRVLDVSERTLRRYIAQYLKQGILFCKHKSIGREPVNKGDRETKQKVIRLVREKYFDFNITHCLEKLKSEEGITNVERETLRKWCHEIHLVKKARRRKAKVRRKRPRMAQTGLLLQMDGSPHYWFGGRKSCLIGAIDDADSDVPYAEFFLSEDTISCMVVLQKIIEKKGVFDVLYVDRAGIFGGPRRCHFSQVKRALAELNIHVLFANSPEAKGRIERLWGTFQDRVVPEMRLRNIQSFEAANDFLQNQFLPNDYAKFKVVPENLETAYRSLPANIDLKEIFCLKNLRMVKRDHTYSWKNEIYAITSPLKYSIYKQKLEIRTYQDLTEKVFFAGKPIEVKKVDAVSSDEKIEASIFSSLDQWKVRLDGHVLFQSKYYSVAESYIGQRVSTKEVNGTLIISQENKTIETHPKILLQGQVSSTKPEHLGPWKRAMEATSQYRRSARRYGPATESVVANIIQEGHGFINTGAIFGILNLDKTYPAKAIEDACKIAEEIGQPNYRTVRSIIRLHATSNNGKLRLVSK